MDLIEMEIWTSFLANTSRKEEVNGEGERNNMIVKCRLIQLCIALGARI